MRLYRYDINSFPKVLEVTLLTRIFNFINVEQIRYLTCSYELELGLAGVLGLTPNKLTSVRDTVLWP